jgi:type III secretion protein Q
MTSISSIGPLLEAVAPASAGASRLLHDRRLAHTWRALDPGRGLALLAVAGPGKGRLYEVRLECDAGRLVLALATIDDTAVALAASTDLGDPLRELAALALFGELARRVDALLLPGTRVLGVSSLPHGDAPGRSWCAIRRGGSEVARVAVLDLPAPVHDALLSKARFAGARSAWRARLALSGGVSIADRAYSIEVLGSLRVADVLLLPLGQLEGAVGRLRLGGCDGRSLSASGHVRGSRLVLTEGLHMTNDDSALLAPTETEPDVLGDLELPVRFELETVSVPLAELEAFEPGYVIEFAMPVEEARLRLVSCGHVIGHADLVAISGRLGARITRLVARDDADLPNR